MHNTRTDSEKGPIVFILRVIIWIDEVPVGIWTIDRHVQSSQRVYDAAETVEIYNGYVVYADTQVVEDSIFE